MAVLTVGSGLQYTTIASAIAAAQTGDTVQVQAGTYVDDFATITKDINLVGVGGMVHMVSDENIPNGKAILVTDANVTIDHFEFSGAQVADGNGAGIRQESGNLTITNSYFHNNQDGILAIPSANGNLSIDSSEFAFNGLGDGQTHDIYVGAIATFSLTNSYIHDANVGHEVKSRAATTTIENNRIFSNSSSDSYEIDLPNGGAATISNNIIQKGANSQNSIMITYGEEGSLYSNSALSINNNTLVSQLTANPTVALKNYTPYTAQLSGNQFYGVSSAAVAMGASTQVGDSFLSSLPTIDSTTHPWTTGTLTPPSNSTIESYGSTSLVQSGSGYFMNPVAGGSGVELERSGAAVTSGEYSGWSPIGAEATSTGYDVAWKNGSQYDVWYTDKSGNYVSELGIVSGSNTSLQSLETTFQQDLNGDGVIGLPGTTSGGTTIESSGSTALIQSASNYFMNPVAGGSGVELERSGAAVTSGQYAGWTPIGAEGTSTGYEVAWKNSSTNQYDVWNTDKTGNYVSELGVVSGSNASLEALEPSFSQDLNGDGVIGVATTTITSYGSTALVQSASNYFMNPVAGGSGVELDRSGAAVTSGQYAGWTPIGAEATSTGYEVAWRNSSTNQYDVWNTDKTGNYVSELGIVSGSNSSLEALEPSFSQDLNGDGVIGVQGTTIESSGSTSLVQSASNYFMNPVAGGSGIELERSGAAVTSGQYSGWTPIGAEATSTGYDVAWKNSSTNQYDVWNTDTNGNYASELGVVSGSNASLEALEPSFSQDLNGDGVIGINQSAASDLIQPLGTDPGAISPTDVSWISGTTRSGGSTTGGVATTGGSTTTSSGFHINLLYDAAAMAAPQSFRDGLQTAMNLLSAAITDNITVNIQIDYSGTGGGAAAGPDGGQFVSYSTVRNDLLANASAGDATFKSLSASASIQGQSNVAVWNAQLKLFGLLSPNDTTTDDGSATFATDINPNDLVGVALHELTHALGRVPYGSQPDIFDFDRFTSPGTELFSSASTAPAAYFSLDGGVTKIADYGQTSDPSDFLNSGVQGTNDPFDEFYSSSTLQQLTATDLQQLDALGFHLASTAAAPAPAPTPTPTTTIESLGSTSLIQSGSNYLMNPVAGGSGVELERSGAAVTSGQYAGWTPIGAEGTATGFEVAWKNSSTNQYDVWNTDKTGNYVSELGVLSGSNSSLEALEPSFSQDLNGDGVIGLPGTTSGGTTIESSGSTALVQSASNYFMNPVAGGSGVELERSGAAVTSGQYAGWTPIGAEGTATGFEVAWKNSSTNQYDVWNTDKTGNYVSELGVVSGSNSSLEALETSFSQDLNGDGVIGVPGTTSGGTTIESYGSTALLQSASNYFMNPVAGGSSVELERSGAAVTSGQYAGWTPIGAESTLTGYEVAWKNSSTNQYDVWNTDKTGNYVSELGIVSGSSSSLQALEPSFHQDLNGDGVTGLNSPSTAVAAGSLLNQQHLTTLI